MSKAQWGSEYRTSSEQSAPSPPLIWQLKWVFLFPLIPHAGEASREIANLTERKNLHMPVYGVKRIGLFWFPLGLEGVGCVA